MNALDHLHKIAVGALVFGFVGLVYKHFETHDELSDIRYAISQSKQGERFTAQDGRSLCRALLKVHPDAMQHLPDVCKQ